MDAIYYCGTGKGQARDGKGWPLRRKVLKLKPLPRAYIKVGCHHPPQEDYDGRGQQTASPMLTAIMSGGVGISGLPRTGQPQL